MENRIMMLKITNSSGSSVTHQGTSLVDGGSIFIEGGSVLCNATNTITHYKYDSGATAWTAVPANHSAEWGNLTHNGIFARILKS